MPLYPYRCSCGFEDTFLQAVNDPAPKHCGKPMKRKWDGATVASKFIGGGFHTTDYPSLGGSKGNSVMTVRNKSTDSTDRRAKHKSVKGVEDRLR